MGHFGYTSDANDTCWDLLGRFAAPDAADGFPTTQLQADHVCAFIHSGFAFNSPEDQAYWAKQDESDTVLGPVVYLLNEGFRVPKALLERALAVARARRRSKAYLANWKPGTEREEALALEITVLRSELLRLAKETPAP